MLRVIPLLLALAACTSCGHFSSYRSAVQQHNAMVRINATCPDGSFRGSGVMVSPQHVLTAEHVATCELLPAMPEIGINHAVTMPALKLTIWVTDEVSVEAEIEATASPGADLARLKMARSMPDVFSPVRLGPPPQIGDRICEASAVPRSTYRCGEAQESPTGHIGLGFMVENGNSGSGIYNAKGELIGITTMLIYCQNRLLCAGIGTALAGYAWMMPES